MSLRDQAGFFIAIAAAICALLMLTLSGGAKGLSPENAMRNGAFFGALAVALLSGFLSGWILGPLFGQRGFGGWILGLIGVLLATALSGLIAGGFTGAFHAFVRESGDLAALLGESLATGLLISFVMTRYLFGSGAFFGVWAALFVTLQVLMARRRRDIALERSGG